MTLSKVLLAIVAGPVVLGCSSETADGQDAGTHGEGLEDVIYEGGATDEALVVLLDASPVSVPAQAAVVDEPADGATVGAATPATVAWHIGQAGGTSAPFPKHGTPINGRAYFLTFESDTGDRLARVFTTSLTYTPSADVWASFAGAGGPVQLSILNAVFENNLIVADSGPFEGVPSSFTVAD